MAYAKKTDTFYIAMTDQITQYTFIDLKVDNSRHYTNFNMNFERSWSIPASNLSVNHSQVINVIKIEKIADESVLVCGTSLGLVFIYFIERPISHQGPLTISLHHIEGLNSEDPGCTRVPSGLNDLDYLSIWGVSIASKNHWLAVSSNSHKIIIFDLLVRLEPKKTTNVELSPDCCILEERDLSHIIDHSHAHNIPMVSFNSSEDSLASVSIDGTAKVWSIARIEGRIKATLKCLYLTKNLVPLWSCIWFKLEVDSRDELFLEDLLAELVQELRQQYLQKKSFKTITFSAFLKILRLILGNEFFDVIPSIVGPHLELYQLLFSKSPFAQQLYSEDYYNVKPTLLKEDNQFIFSESLRNVQSQDQRILFIIIIEFIEFKFKKILIGDKTRYEDISYTELLDIVSNAIDKIFLTEYHSNIEEITGDPEVNRGERERIPERNFDLLLFTSEEQVYLGKSGHQSTSNFFESTVYDLESNICYYQTDFTAYLSQIHHWLPNLQAGLFLDIDYNVIQVPRFTMTLFIEEFSLIVLGSASTGVIILRLCKAKSRLNSRFKPSFISLVDAVFSMDFPSNFDDSASELSENSVSRETNEDYIQHLLVGIFYRVLGPDLIHLYLLSDTKRIKTISIAKASYV